MKENEKLPFDIDEIVRSLPPRQECADASRDHQDYIKMCVNDFKQLIAAHRPWYRGLADLTVSLTRNLKDGFENVVKWGDSLIPDFDLSSAPNYACATRAIGGGRENGTPTKLSFEKFGDGCSLKVELEVASSGGNLNVRLLDDAGNAILPFSLTVTDAESGKVLLPCREFKAGTATIKGIEIGRYEIVASSGSVKCDFWLTVE